MGVILEGGISLDGALSPEDDQRGAAQPGHESCDGSYIVM